MSQPCAIEDCKRASRAICHCCNQNLCRDHFVEHDDLLNSQLNPLADEINTLADRLTAINIDGITSNCRKKLDQWRIDCHKKIDEFYEEKCKELDRYANENVNEERKAVTNLRSQMSELIEKQETTKHDINSLTSGIRTLDRQMSEAENIRIEMNIHPLILDNRLIEITRAKTHQFDLLNLSSAYLTMNKIGIHDYEMASSDRFLLVYFNRNLCLMDKDLSIAKQTEWNDSLIGDMCWSSVLRCFFVITEKTVFSIDENSLSLKPILEVEGEDLWSCECSNESLYLSQRAWNSCILEYRLLPSVQFIKVWKTTDPLNNEQRVDNIKYYNGTLALVINDQSNRKKFIELRSLKTFSPIWSIRLDIQYNTNVTRCCSLKNAEWLVSDRSTSNFFHIAYEGEIKGKSKYTFIPYNINLFGSNILVIISDEGINFFKL